MQVTISNASHDKHEVSALTYGYRALFGDL